MTIGWNEIIWLGIGTAVGLLAGVAIYWAPLGQFGNEWKAIWSLRRRYNQGDELTVRAGIDLKPLDSRVATATLMRDTQMKIWNDKGVGWHHTHSGWKRARILHVFDPATGGVSDVYKICHLDLR
ncbi:hypothetical protein AZI87_05870 [Bdellovibrio bacteriovorus]|uniref:Uncharacterized protein n=1 Tax=Bdellovibrio bacteriovorus TaxID=959 RepID=A0A161PTS8_BDEBC|nr:hypothetical protein [Bdellovibrio bacteriovorus]KYG68758.1 hypothetical protein AZI87_05870 [Bdellovibrio bacteriovorus]